MCRQRWRRWSKQQNSDKKRLLSFYDFEVRRGLCFYVICRNHRNEMWWTLNRKRIPRTKDRNKHETERKHRMNRTNLSFSLSFLSQPSRHKSAISCEFWIFHRRLHFLFDLRKSHDMSAGIVNALAHTRERRNYESVNLAWVDRWRGWKIK